MIEILCKHKDLDVDFSKKHLECLCDFIDDDEDMVQDETLSSKKQIKNLEKIVDKYSALISGEEVQFGDWICKLVEVGKEE